LYFSNKLELKTHTKLILLKIAKGQARKKTGGRLQADLDELGVAEE
jgi:hypothetical protein